MMGIDITEKQPTWKLELLRQYYLFKIGVLSVKLKKLGVVRQYYLFKIGVLSVKLKKLGVVLFGIAWAISVVLIILDFISYFWG
jgi:hypothetical protein